MLLSYFKTQDSPIYRNFFLGKGSNVLFTEHFEGLVIVNRIMGKEVTETDEDYLLHIAGGEDWPELVSWCVNQGIGGIENLALIPGCAGSAPIQNIGAYGLELKDICDYVDVLDLTTFENKRMHAQDCEFAYRDSIFKHALHGKCFITALGLKLAKHGSRLTSTALYKVSQKNNSALLLSSNEYAKCERQNCQIQRR